MNNYRLKIGELLHGWIFWITLDTHCEILKATFFWQLAYYEKKMLEMHSNSVYVVYVWEGEIGVTWIRFLLKALSITKHARSTQILGQFIYPVHLKLRITLTTFQTSVKAENSLSPPSPLWPRLLVVGGGEWKPFPKGGCKHHARDSTQVRQRWVVRKFYHFC